MTAPTAAFRVPASTSNLGPGFDTLSFAVELYLRVEIRAAEGDRTGVLTRGIDSSKIPTGPDNLMLRVMDRIREDRGICSTPVDLTVDNEIPLARGLGSSAAAIVAAITCFELIADERLSVDEIFGYADEFEPHPDNLAAALFGGLTVSATRADGSAMFSRVEMPDPPTPVLVIPDFELSTEEARKSLPDTYSRQDAVFNVQRTAMLVAALSSGNFGHLGEAMHDRIHQPYRASLIPGLEDILSMETDGLLGVALSGAGPTILALADREQAAAVGRAIVERFAAHGVSARAEITRIDRMGRFSRTHPLEIGPSNAC
jgi:homoserine kinase